MFIKRVSRDAERAEVSTSISRCSCCGKPVMGLSKLGHVSEVQTEVVCSECLKLRNDNTQNR
jgi:hypothetical protein